jgi:hypothetical protein
VSYPPAKSLLSSAICCIFRDNAKAKQLPYFIRDLQIQENFSYAIMGKTKKKVKSAKSFLDKDQDLSSKVSESNGVHSPVI